ncbi:V-type ATP synthase subunit I [Halosquirtibacter laminarini]|uniref:V-type ATP synthase subunit I n=1 Tax=Halosquirtibacter laminarini TaxID=3374600 RepID=A0AC61NRC8_9BACT|nr:V-type ATP synthase subunit I [Prolixibacteraceae bacterium]
MKKLSFLLFHKEYESFLENLRSLGVVHINEKEGGVEDPQLDESIQELARVEGLIKEFHKILDAQDEVQGVQDAALVEKYESPETLKQTYSELAEVKELETARLHQLDKSAEAWQPWGDFDISTLEKLQDAGWNLHFFACHSRDFNEQWREDYELVEISQVGMLHYFVIVSKQEETVDIEADIVTLPSLSLSEVGQALNEVNSKLEYIDRELTLLAAIGLPVMEEYQQTVKDQVDFNKVRLDGDALAENHVYMIEGFVPIESLDEVCKYLDTEQVYYEQNDPSFEERVPVLLKNGRFARMFEMVGDLYSLPKYGELDLTPFFAPFYLLFFGFCLGDAGYGILLMILGFVFTPKTEGSTQNAMKLSKWLGASTILFGLISGTFFGMDLYAEGWGVYGTLNDMLKAQGKTMNDHLFNLALIFGAVQVIFGMVLKAVNETKQFGIRYAVSTIGWITLFVGLALSYSLPAFGLSEGSASIFRYVVLVFWVLASLLFNNPDRSIFANLGAGIWDSYNMATGVMGDILSYIRLFALGISSSILGFVFNNLAVQFAPDNIVGKIIVMTIILLIGHGLNLFMGVLGSFVHPVRLTFVEFYKNSGFTGGGVRYNPFRKRVK